MTAETDAMRLVPEDLKLIIAHTIIEDLRVQHPDILQIDNERGDVWLPGGVTPQSAGCVVDIHSLAQSVEQEILATLRPGHTDLMVTPESIDAFLAENPLPAAPVSPDSDLLKEAVGQTRFYIDCEFDGHNGPLLSLAVVREDGHSIHIRADVEPMDLWVRKNVLPIMDQHDASESATVYHDRVGDVIRQFIGPCERPVIIADSPVDIGRFCRALSTGPDGQWASTDYPLMAFEVHNVDCYPTELEGAVQHNAWWDAMALRAFLSKVEGRG